MSDAKRKISVIMSVCNGERFLREAVDSILNQTFDDFEFIVIDDGSTDGTRDILESYRDSRLRVTHQENVGLTASLNRGIGLAHGEYIARMDADDVSLPERLARETEALDSDSGISVVDSAVLMRGAAGDRVRRMTDAFAALPVALLRVNPLAHGNVMMRKAHLIAVRGYNERFRCAQDLDLWLRMAWRGYRFRLIPDVLYQFRLHAGSITNARQHEQLTYARQARLSILRGIRNGTYKVPGELRPRFLETLMSVAGSWSKSGLYRETREVGLTLFKLFPTNACGCKLVLRSYAPIRRWYDLAAGIRSAARLPASDSTAME